MARHGNHTIYLQCQIHRESFSTRAAPCLCHLNRLELVLTNQPAARCSTHTHRAFDCLDRVETSTYTRARQRIAAPSLPARAFFAEPVAQPVEHVTFNHGVLGSSPSGLTTRSKQPQHNTPLPSRPGELPSRPGELHPEPLTDPDLTLSRHPARATARRLPPSS